MNETMKKSKSKKSVGELEKPSKVVNIEKKTKKDSQTVLQSSPRDPSLTETNLGQPKSMLSTARVVLFIISQSSLA